VGTDEGLASRLRLAAHAVPALADAGAERYKPVVAGSSLRVFIAEDHPLYLRGLSDAITIRPELALVGQAADGRSALEQIRELEPDVAILDLKMPQLDGLQIVHAVARDGLRTRVLLLSAFTDGDLVHRALTNGAAGFLSKESSAREIVDAVAIAARGQVALAPEAQSALAGALRARASSDAPRLTRRELEILRLLADGLSAGEIADRLLLKVTTVKTHVRNLYEKLGVSDRAEAVARAMRVGLLE
jgi:two-component system nitrate/nitrite response regulator NarL